MPSKGWFLASGLVVVLAGSAVAYRALHPPARASLRAEPAGSRAELGERSDQSEEMERMRAQLASVQGQLAALRTQSAAPKPDVPAETEPRPMLMEDLDPEILRAKREEDAQLWKDHMAEVALAFEDETFDRGFAAPAQSAVEQAIQNQPALKASAGKIECRSRTCRLEFRDAKSPEVGKALPLFLQSLGGTLPNMQADHVEDENGRSTAVLYLTNEQALAQAQPAK